MKKAFFLIVSLFFVSRAWCFQDPYQNLKFYYGDNHYHTGFSDDNTQDAPPLTAFINTVERLKTQGTDPHYGADTTPDLGGYVLFMSDHVKYIPTRIDMTAPQYEIMKQQADDIRSHFQGPQYTFTIFTGGELTGLARSGPYMPWDDKFGHLNIFNVKDMAPFIENSLIFNFKGTYVMDLLATQENAIGQFNHPGYNNEPRTGDDSSSLYPYTEARDKVFNFFEVSDGNPFNWQIGAAQYNLCLQKGYHVSPVIGSDVHDTKSALLFDTKTVLKPARTVIIAPSTINLDQNTRRKILLEAIHKGIVYATEDSNLQIKIAINDFPMGHRFNEIPAKLNIHIDINDPGSPGNEHRVYYDSDKLKTVELLQNKRCVEKGKPIEDKDVTSEAQCTKVLKKWELSESRFVTDYAINTAELDNLKYIYLKVVQQDGDRAMTTPFFFNKQGSKPSLG